MKATNKLYIWRVLGAVFILACLILILEISKQYKPSIFRDTKIPMTVVVTNEFYMQPYDIEGDVIHCTNGMELILIEWYMLECMPGYDWVFMTRDGRVGWYNSYKLQNARIVK